MKILKVSLLLLNVLLLFCQYAMSAFKSDMGHRLDQVLNQTTAQELANSQLYSEILRLQSLSAVSLRAQQLGLRQSPVVGLNPVVLADAKP